MKKTVYYFVSDDAGRYVIAQQGSKTAVFEPDSNELDKTTMMPLYDDTIEDERAELEAVRDRLSEAYKRVEGLYNMEEIERDFPDKVFVNYENSEIKFKEPIVEVDFNGNVR